MKKSLHLNSLLTLVVIGLFFVQNISAQTPTYRCDIRNEAFVAANIFEFDLYLTQTGSTPLELACINSGVLISDGFVNGGTITPSLVSGSELNTSQVPASIDYDAASRCIKIAPQKPPRDYGTGVTSGTIISNTTGTKYCRIRLANSVDFGTDPVNYSWNMNLMPYHTVVSAFTAGASPLVNAIITNEASHAKSNNLTLYLEGLYTEGVGNHKAQGDAGDYFAGPVADEITVSLADATAPYSEVFSAAHILLYTNGKCSFAVPGELNCAYYIVVKHRNSIETWSAAPVSFASVTVSYDFSAAASQAYGNNMNLMGSFYTLWGGDATQDGIVDGSDMSGVYNESTAVLTGYHPEDVNGDGIVDGSDMAMIFNNSTAVVTSVKP